MPDVVHLPGGHGLDKKQTIALVAGIGLVGAYVLLKRRSVNAAASADTASTDGTSGDTGSGYDPSLDGGDSSALYPYGYGTAVDSGYYDPSTGQYIGTGVGQPGPVLTQVSTNAAWAMQAEATLAQMGYNPITVGNALGKYLSGQGLTPDQESIVQAAIGFEGQPPQPVPPPHLVPEPGHKPHKTIIANGKMTLYQIAHANHDTETQVVAMNPHLGVYVGTKRPVKKGTRVKV